jgi:phage/plasmid-like protein (TIGR03299 family)
MAHELDFSRGRAAYFGAFEPAWHRLGVTIDHAADSAEARRLALLDWTVEARGLVTVDGKPITTHVANVRSDTGAVLGVVGEGYTPLQNDEAFDFMDSLVGEKLAMYHTAGALKGGRKVWMLAKIPKEYRIGGEDVVEPYVLLTNAHDGSRALRMLATTVRVVCQNTLNLALSRAAGGISIRHTGGLPQRVDEARRALGIICKRTDSFAVEAQRMADCKLSRDRVGQFFRLMFPNSVGADGATAAGLLLANSAAPADLVARIVTAANERTEGLTRKQADANADIVARVWGNYETRRNHLPGIEESVWSAYNAVSDWADHQRKARGKGDYERRENRLESVWFGPANEVKQAAYDVSLALAC